MVNASVSIKLENCKLHLPRQGQTTIDRKQDHDQARQVGVQWPITDNITFSLYAAYTNARMLTSTRNTATSYTGS
jgi:hypothetical protein